MSPRNKHSRRLLALIPAAGACALLLGAASPSASGTPEDTASPSTSTLLFAPAKAITIGHRQTLVSRSVVGRGTSAELTPELQKEARNAVRDSGGDLASVETQLANADTFDRVMGAIQEQNPSTFVDAGYSKAGGTDVWVRFTVKPSLAIDAQLAVLPFDSIIEWGAPLNDQQLEAISAQIGQTVNGLGVSALQAGADPMTGQIKIAANFTSDQAIRVAQAATLISNQYDLTSLPEISITSDPSLKFDNEALLTIGGAQLTDTQSSSYCTGAFSVAKGSATGIVTARHCSNYLAYNGSTGVIKFASEDSTDFNGGRVDLQWHQDINGYKGDAHFQTDGNRATQNVVTSGANADVGATVCHFGYGSGTQRCGYVKARNQNVTFSDGVYYTGMTQTTTDISTGGDSGGPWFSGNIARGVHKGSGNNSSYYVPQTQLGEALGLSLVKQ